MYYPNAETFLQIIFEALHAPYGTSYNYRGVNWAIIYKYADASSLLALTLETVERIAQHYEIPKDIIEKWEKGAKEEVIFSEQQQQALKLFLQEAQVVQLPYTVFKGSVLATLYPNPAFRRSKDTDLFIAMEDTAEIFRFLQNRGYLKEERTSKEEVPVFIHPQSLHKIELHYTLWEEFKGPKIQLLNNMHITDKNSFIEVETLGCPTKTLGYTQHLIYIIFHTIKHMVTEGIAFQCLVDVALYVDAYKEKIDFKHMWEMLEELGYDYFSELLFYCAIRYLHMDDSIMDGRGTPSYEDVGCMIVEFIRDCTMRLTPEYEVLLADLTKIYVDGVDDQYNVPAFLEQNEETFKPIRERVDEKLKFIHTFHLSCQEAKVKTKTYHEKEIKQLNLSDAKRNARYFYRAYDLTIASEIEMDELFHVTLSEQEKAQADIYVYQLEQPDALKNPAVQKVTPSYIWFEVACGRIVCRNGNEIIAEPDTPELMKELKHYIISHAMCFNMYMRGIVPFHSSSVGDEKGAVLIVGDCGAGKSTYSALLRKEGYGLLADDVSAVTIKDEIPYVHLSVPQQKYTVESAEKEGYKLEELECVDEARGKYRLRLKEEQMCASAKPMKAIFELIPDWQNDELKIEKLEGMGALKLLTSYIFSQYMSNHNDGLSVEAFQTLLCIAQKIPVYRIYRPTSRDARQEVLQMMLEHCQK